MLADQAHRSMRTWSFPIGKPAGGLLKGIVANETSSDMFFDIGKDPESRKISDAESESVSVDALQQRILEHTKTVMARAEESISKRVRQELRMLAPGVADGEPPARSVEPPAALPSAEPAEPPSPPPAMEMTAEEAIAGRCRSGSSAIGSFSSEPMCGKRLFGSELHRGRRGSMTPSSRASQGYSARRVTNGTSRSSRSELWDDVGDARNVFELDNEIGCEIVHTQTCRIDESQQPLLHMSQVSSIKQGSNMQRYFLLALRAFGIIPLGARSWSCYQLFVHLVFVALVSLNLRSLPLASEYIYLRASTASYTLCNMVGLATLQFAGVKRILGGGAGTLERMTNSYGFLEEWMHTSRRWFCGLLVLWCCITVSNAYLVLNHSECASGSSEHFMTRIGYLFLLTFGIGLALVLTFCQVHVCCCLELMVDKFCIRLLRQNDLERAISEWNVLHVCLRRSGTILDGCCIAMFTAALAVSMLLCAEVAVGDGGSWGRCTLVWWISGLPVPVLAFIALFRAAAVSEKCQRVPPLITMLQLEDATSAINYEQQFVVQHIRESKAGFYIKGMRLNLFSVLKVSYLALVITVAIATRLIQSRAVMPGEQ